MNHILVPKFLKDEERITFLSSSPSNVEDLRTLFTGDDFMTKVSSSNFMNI